MTNNLRWFLLELILPPFLGVWTDQFIWLISKCKKRSQVSCECWLLTCTATMFLAGGVFLCIVLPQNKRNCISSSIFLASYNCNLWVIKILHWGKFSLNNSDERGLGSKWQLLNGHVFLDGSYSLRGIEVHINENQMWSQCTCPCDNIHQILAAMANARPPLSFLQWKMQNLATRKAIILQRNMQILIPNSVWTRER